MLAAIRKRVTSASTLSLVRGFHSTKALCNQQVSVDIVKAGPKIMDTLEQTHTDEVPDSLVSGTFNELTKRKVVIYRPTKNAMQSRHNESKPWSITFEPTDRWTNPLMGWPSSEDTAFNQIFMMKFESEQAAITYCQRQGLDYEVRDPAQRSYKPKSYAANFKWKGNPKKEDE